MYDVVKKIVAREDFNRVITESSYDEMLKFTEEGIRPDFSDNSILCIKFIIETCEDDDTPEQTDWHINPYYFRGEGRQFPYNLKMDCDFVPEIILINMDTVDVRNKYAEFSACLMFEGDVEFTEEEKYNKFLEVVFNND